LLEMTEALVDSDTFCIAVHQFLGNKVISSFLFIFSLIFLVLIWNYLNHSQIVIPFIWIYLDYYFLLSFYLFLIWNCLRL
jgi:hypothetical protein